MNSRALAFTVTATVESVAVPTRASIGCQAFAAKLNISIDWVVAEVGLSVVRPEKVKLIWLALAVGEMASISTLTGGCVRRVLGLKNTLR